MTWSWAAYAAGIATPILLLLLALGIAYIRDKSIERRCRGCEYTVRGNGLNTKIGMRLHQRADHGWPLTIRARKRAARRRGTDPTGIEPD